MGKFSPRRVFRRIGLLAAGVLAAAAVQAEPVSADRAQQLLARGAIALDIRPASAFSAGHLPGAAQLDGHAWDLAALEAAVSTRGIDLSREVVVYGASADPEAAALYQRLREVAPGRIYWLVGGVNEWTHGGRALRRDAVVRAPVPQRLSQLREQPAAPESRLAAASLRRTAEFTIAAAVTADLNAAAPLR